jgi:hypothetical protein
VNPPPWFKENAGGGWWVPATREGYVVLAAFIVFVLATVWLPADYKPPTLIGLGLAYLGASFWLSQSR